MTDEELRALIEAHPVEGAPQQMRAAFEALAEAAGPVDLEGLEVTEGILGGVLLISLRPRNEESKPPIVHLHGGGYVFGSPKSHLGLAACLARTSGRSVMLPSYPLAPEYEWPAQKEAVSALLAELGQPYVLSGDSAGGHLALICALAGARPEALLLFSPNTCRAYGLSRTRGAASDAMCDHDTDVRLATMAFGSLEPSNHEQSPVRSRLTGLPPVFVDVGTDEVLLDDSLRLIDRLARQAVPVTARIRPGFHLIQLFAASYEPGRRSLEAAATWLRGEAGA